MQGLNLIQGKNISIHALREEGDLVTFADTSIRLYFYPRPPRGGRPGFSPRPQQSCYDFYPRPPRGGRLKQDGSELVRDRFLSTPSARRATWSGYPPGCYPPISIHALREEGDEVFILPKMRVSYFYPRPPRGGRQQKQRQNLYFQTNYTTFCTNLEEP